MTRICTPLHDLAQDLNTGVRKAIRLMVALVRIKVRPVGIRKLRKTSILLGQVQLNIKIKDQRAVEVSVVEMLESDDILRLICVQGSVES